MSPLNEAQRDLVESNLKLAFAVAWKADWATRLSREEREAEAMFGLVQSAAGYDASKGFAFASYAVPVIAGVIRRANRNAVVVRRLNPVESVSVGADGEVRDRIAELADPGTSPRVVAERDRQAEAREAMYAAVGRLPDKQREAVEDHLEGLNLVESGRRRGVSHEAIRTRLGRAMVAIRAGVPTGGRK